MSGPATVKRGRGRPRKDGLPNKSSAVVVKNPDCEPATKGYVKCIARKVMEHSHKKDSKYAGVLLGALIGWFWLMCNAIIISTHQLSETNFYILLATTTVLTLVSIDLVRAEDDYTYTPNNQISAIQKYVPPEEIQRVCEVFNKPEKECEE